MPDRAWWKVVVNVRFFAAGDNVVSEEEAKERARDLPSYSSEEVRAHSSADDAWYVVVACLGTVRGGVSVCPFVCVFSYVISSY